VAVRFFNDNATVDSRACQIWQILVDYAMRRQTLTYQDLAHLLGHNQPEVFARQLGCHLLLLPAEQASASHCTRRQQDHGRARIGIGTRRG